MRVKGMVQVLGATYRVVRLEEGLYEAIRILDDTAIGRFRTVPVATLVSTTIDENVMREIIRASIHGAKTSWVGRLSLA
jgi:hypothetical protein